MKLLSVVALAPIAISSILGFGSSGANAQTAGFADVPAAHWASQSVSELTKIGIIQGQSDSPLGVQAKAATMSKGKGGAAAAYDGNKPVTRYELAVTLYRFVQYVEHADKMRKTKYGAEALPISGPDALKRLIADGYLPSSTPLAKDGQKPVTANQLADAMAEVLIKSREKSTPLSPDLRDQKIERPASSSSKS